MTPPTQAAGAAEPSDAQLAAIIRGMVALTNIGWAPDLRFDDDGHWKVQSDTFCEAPWHGSPLAAWEYFVRVQLDGHDDALAVVASTATAPSAPTDAKSALAVDVRSAADSLIGQIKHIAEGTQQGIWRDLLARCDTLEAALASTATAPSAPTDAKSAVASDHDPAVCDAALKLKLAEVETKLAAYVDWCDNMNTGPMFFESQGCQGPECRDGILHKSDCAIHNGDALPVGPCDCGAATSAQDRAAPFEKALELRISQGWQLGGNACPILYTDSINGEQVMRDDLWIATTAGLKGAQDSTTPSSVSAESDVFFPCVDDKDNERLNRIEALMQTVFDGKEVPQVWFKRADVYRIVAAALTPPAPAAAPQAVEADDEHQGFNTGTPALDDLLQETWWMAKGPNNHDTVMAWMGALEAVLPLLATPSPAVSAEPVARVHKAIDAFEQRERGMAQAHIAAKLVAELRAALAQLQPGTTQGDA